MDVETIPLIQGAFTGDIILASGEIPKQDWVRLDSEILLRASTWLREQRVWANRPGKYVWNGAPQAVITVDVQHSPSKLWVSQACGALSISPISSLPHLALLSTLPVPSAQVSENGYMKAQLDACWRAFKAACVILHTGGIVWQPDQRSDIFIEHLIRLAETMRIASRLKHAVFDLLFQAKSDLFQSAQRMPIRYLKIAYVLQNAALFKEAAIHVISRWPCAEKEAIEEAMSCGSLLRFIEEKHEKLVRCVDMVHLRISRLEVVSRNYAGKLDAEALLATSLFRTNFSHRTKISCASCEHEPGKGCTSGLVDLWLGFKMGEPRAFSDEEIKTSFVGSGIF